MNFKPSAIDRLQHMDWICAFCAFARKRGNGFSFSYSRAQYLPRSIGES